MPNAPSKFRARPVAKPVDYRASASERGYDGQWAKVARMRLAIEPFCRRCGDGVAYIATIPGPNEFGAGVFEEDEFKRVPNLCADHIIPVHVRPDLRLDLDNTQTLCRRCNRIKGIEDDSKYRAG